MLSYLIYFLIILFPLGELVRIDIGNSIIFKPLDIACVIILLTTLIKYRKRFLAMSGPLMKPLFIFILAAALSLVLNIPYLKPVQLATSSMYLLRFVSYASLFFAVYFSDQKTKKIVTILLFIINIVILLMGFVQFAYYTNLINLSYLGWDQHWWRLYATFFDPNYAGVYLVLFLMLILNKILIAKPREKIFFSLISLFTLIAILLTFSRSAFLSLLAGLFSYLFLFKKNKKIILGLLTVFSIGIILMLTHSSGKYTEGTKLFRSVSSISRVKSLEAAWFIFSKQPIFGVGFNAYRYAQLRYGTANAANWEVSHSNAGVDDSFLFVMGTTGIAGSLAFLYLLKKIFSLTKKSQLALSTLVAILTGSLFINALFFPVIMAWMWIILGLTIEKE